MNEQAWGSAIIWGTSVSWSSANTWGINLIWTDPESWANAIIWGTDKIGYDYGAAIIWGTTAGLTPQTTAWNDLAGETTATGLVAGQ
jgi:hypothetical protein